LIAYTISMEAKKKLERVLKKLDISSLSDDQAAQILDILEKKTSVKQTQETGILSLFEKIFEWMPYAIAVTDSQGNFIKTNKLFIELFRTEPKKDHGIFDDPVLRKAGYGSLLEKARKGEYAEIPELWFNINDYYPDRPPYRVCIRSIVYPILNRKKIENFVLVIENITDKKLIESELLAGSEKYKLIFENIQDIYYETSLDGILLEISPSVENFSQYKRKELIGANLLDIYWDASAREVLVKELREKGYVRNYLTKLKDKDGSMLIASANIRMLFNKEKKPYRIIGSLIDISDSQKTLEALKLSEEKYREIFDNANEMICTSDLEGNIITINTALGKNLGYKYEELESRNLRDFLTEDSFQRIRENIQLKIEHPGESTIFEVEAIAKDGAHVFFEVSCLLKFRNSEPYQIFGIARNISERKKAEEELNSTHQKYMELFESSNDIIYTMNFNGNFTSVNPMAEKLLGYKFDEMTNPNMIRFITPETAKIAFDNIKAKLKGDRSSTIYEVEFLKKDGTYISLEINSQLRFKDGKPIEIFGIARDITIRKRAEEELNKTREKYMELFDSSNDIVYTMDFKGNFTSVNKTAEKLLGLKFEELSDVNVKSYLTPESAKRALADVIKKLKGQSENTVYEVDFININGNIVTFEINSQVRYKKGKPFEVFGIARDVTERKKANEAIRLSEEKYRMIFENAPLGIMTADISGNIIEINPVLLQMLGSKSVQETKSINVLSFPPMVMAGLVEKFVKCMETGESVVSEHTYTSKWGKSLDTRIYTKPIKNSRGRITGFQTIVEDITEEKESERQIKSALNEKEVLIREIHHRVKNNMQIIISLINMQMQDSNDAVMIRKFKELQQRVRSMSIIHEDLYMSEDLSRINFGNYLKKLANNLLQIYPYRQEIKLRFNVSDILLGIDTAIPCGLIVNELLSNSLKYAFPENCAAKIKEYEIFVEFIARNNKYLLVVGDTGIGLPPDVDERKSKTLGLLLVEILVTQIKGEMKMINKKGTRYEIEMEKEKEKK
jgi:PAS domain S-box-containing protein